MPRRKLTTINLKELECYPALIEELWNNPNYSVKDLSTLKLTVLDSYKPTIKEVDKQCPERRRRLRNWKSIELAKCKNCINEGRVYWPNKRQFPCYESEIERFNPKYGYFADFLSNRKGYGTNKTLSQGIQASPWIFRPRYLGMEWRWSMKWVLDFLYTPQVVCKLCVHKKKKDLHIIVSPWF